MKSFTIKSQKEFTKQLFTGTLFDSFLLCDADFKTCQTYHIDGHVIKDYFDTEEELPSDRYTPWSLSKPICFQIIKGKRLPSYFRIVFTLSDKNLASTLESYGTELSPSDVEGMYLNIHYKDGILFCTSGIALSVFTMDRSLPEYWDKLIEKFFVKNNIEFE